MKPVRKLLDFIYSIKILKPFHPVIDAVDAAFFSPSELTEVKPHILDNIDLKRYMFAVIIALMPSTISAVVFYGWYVLAMIVVSYAAGGIVEVIFALIRKKHIEEGFFVTGIIFPLVLPPTTPLWIVAVGVAFGVFFGKEVFGGTGRNPFNPALIGRLFITIAFPSIMTVYWKLPFSDVITAATPLTMFKSSQTITPYIDLLLGQCAGSMGETFRIGIIAGGIFLLFSKVADWKVSISYIASVFVFAWIGNALFPLKIAPPVFQVLAGGLLYGAFFMATDPVTSPFTKAGKWIFGIMCGLLTVLIRTFSGYVEGVMFSIVIMNAFTPILDHLVLSIKYRR